MAGTPSFEGFTDLHVHFSMHFSHASLQKFHTPKKKEVIIVCFIERTALYDGDAFRYDDTALVTKRGDRTAGPGPYSDDHHQQQQQQRQDRGGKMYATVRSRLLKGNAKHWMCCALYVACLQELPAVGHPDHFIQGNGVNITNLLSQCNIKYDHRYNLLKCEPLSH
uniref:Uncharacterized protein n=1 Tax=Anopheles stephensi TaxID=30069 RepID=A0A182YFI9_ANOST